MEIDYSKTVNDKARQYKLKPEALAFADLVSLGWDEKDAYFIAFRLGLSWTKKALRDEINKLMVSEGVKNRIADNTRSKREAVNERKSERRKLLEQATSKEEMLLDLQRALESMQTGSQEWRDTKKMIIDVSRMKSDEVKTGESTIHYYLPVNYPTSCENCLLNPMKDLTKRK